MQKDLEFICMNAKNWATRESNSEDENKRENVSGVISSQELYIFCFFFYIFFIRSPSFSFICRHFFYSFLPSMVHLTMKFHCIQAADTQIFLSHFIFHQWFYQLDCYAFGVALEILFFYLSSNIDVLLVISTRMKTAERVVKAVDTYFLVFVEAITTATVTTVERELDEEEVFHS